MSADEKPKKWLSTEIPLWGVIMMAVSMGGWVVNLEYRVRALEADAVTSKKAYEAVGRMAWQIDTVAKDFTEVRENLKAITTQSMDIWMLQREVSDLNCRTGGRCLDNSARKPK